MAQTALKHPISVSEREGVESSSGKSLSGITFFPIFLIILTAIALYTAFASPSITFVSPTLQDNATTGSNWVYINLTASENLNQSLLEWGNSTGFTNVTMSNSSATNWYVNMTNLADGTYNYTIYAQNTTGNWNQTARRFVTVDTTPPSISFTSPTPANNSYIPRNFTEMNLTINESNLDTFKFNWNNANYSFYDSSLVLAMNFNNNSAIGENDMKAVDISRYGNTGTVSGTSNTLDNDTVLYANQTAQVNLTHLISIPAVNFTSDFNLTISYRNNTYANETIRVYLNGSYIGNFTTVGATTTQYAYSYDILRGNFTAGTVSNITYEANSTNITRSRLEFKNTLRVQGRFGSAMKFDGVDDYVRITNFNAPTSAITVSAWIRTADPKAVQFVAGQGNTGSLGWRMYVGSGSIIVSIVGGAAIAMSYPNSDWNHVSVVYNGSAVIMYVNAIAGTPVALSGNIDYTGLPDLIVGHILQGISQGARFFNGTIDELRIYNRSLSASEILLQYQSEFSKYNPTEWRFYDNITNLTDGGYTYYGWANDTAGNSNSSETRTLTVDTAPPSVSLSLSQSSIYVGDSITIGCSASDAHLSTASLTVTEPDNTPASATCNQPFSTSAQGTYTVQYSATDTLGHSASISQTFSASNWLYSSGGGPFSSGGSASKTIVVTSNEAVEKIIVTLTSRITNQFATVARVDAPATGPLPTEAVYQYLNITKQNFENPDIETARIDFRVNKSWYSGNEIVPSSTALFKYDGQSWHSLPTIQTGEDLATYSFSANTTSFSLFAITGAKRPKPAPPTVTAILPTATIVPTIAVPTPATPPIATSTSSLASKPLPSWWALPVVLLSILAAIAVYLKKSRPPGKTRHGSLNQGRSHQPHPRRL